MHYNASSYVSRERLESMPGMELVAETGRLMHLVSQALDRLNDAEEGKVSLYDHQMKRMQELNTFYTFVAIERMKKLKYED